MPRVLLLLPAETYRAADFLAAAAAVGADVVVASDVRQAMAPSMGDRALTIDLDRPVEAAAAIVALAARLPLDAVVGVDDQGVLVAALAASRLGLPHNSPTAVAATRDKAAMRHALHLAGVAQPRFAVLGSERELAEALEVVGLPCVVKPVSLSGSRGVIRADDLAAATTAVGRTRAIVADAGRPVDESLLLEQYVPGHELAVEGLLRNGDLEVLALFDKPDPLEGPYFEETIYVTPSRRPEAERAAIGQLMAEAAAALGLREGPIHGEVRIDGTGRPWVLEVAARSIGGLCARTLRFGAGLSLETLILEAALGRPRPHSQREGAASGVMMVPIPRNGLLGGVRGVEAARATDGVEAVEITIPRGRPVRALPEGDRYLGFLFARGPTPADVERSLRAAHECLEVIIDPDEAPSDGR